VSPFFPSRRASVSSLFVPTSASGHWILSRQHVGDHHLCVDCRAAGPPMGMPSAAVHPLSVSRSSFSAGSGAPESACTAALVCGGRNRSYGPPAGVGVLGRTWRIAYTSICRRTAQVPVAASTGSDPDEHVSELAPKRQLRSCERRFAGGIPIIGRKGCSCQL
jgi:hypothetical protein